MELLHFSHYYTVSLVQWVNTVVGTVTEETNDYFATRYWALKKSNYYFATRYWAPKKSNYYFATRYWAPKKSNNYFATRYWNLKKVTIISLLVTGV